MRLVLRHHRDRVSALQPLHRRAHRLEEIAAVLAVHEVRDHLGIGLAFERVAAALQLAAQFLVVLDDAVMHQRDLAA